MHEYEHDHVVRLRQHWGRVLIAQTWLGLLVGCKGSSPAVCWQLPSKGSFSREIIIVPYGMSVM